MNNEDLNKIVDKRLEAVRAILIKKGTEYSTMEDRLLNFKLGAKKSGLTPLQVLQGYKLKHEVSIDEMCVDYELGEIIGYEKINEKFTDDIAYRILQECILMEDLKSKGL